MLNLSHIKEMILISLVERNLRKAFVTSTALDWRPPVPLPEVRPRQRQGQHQGTELPVSDSEPPAPRPVRSRAGLLKETVHRALRSLRLGTRDGHFSYSQAAPIVFGRRWH